MTSSCWMWVGATLMAFTMASYAQVTAGCSALAANEPRIGFYILDGSHFGDWNVPDDFLRGCTATPTYGLGCVYAGGAFGSMHVWDLTACALGEPIGMAMLEYFNNTNEFPGGASRDLTLLGDPTLRLQVTSPPSNLTAMLSPSQITLQWTPAAETTVQYFIYRSSSSNGPFTNHIASVCGDTWTDTAPPPPGSRTYALKTAQLVVTGSGSYTNLSQAIFISR